MTKRRPSIGKKLGLPSCPPAATGTNNDLADGANSAPTTPKSETRSVSKSARTQVKQQNTYRRENTGSGQNAKLGNVPTEQIRTLANDLGSVWDIRHFVENLEKEREAVAKLGTQSLERRRRFGVLNQLINELRARLPLQPRSLQPISVPSGQGSAPQAKRGKNARVEERPGFSVQFETGCATQFSNRKENQICDVVVGVDFGTSCSKVIVHTPYVQHVGFAVPFGAESHTSSQYFLPSAVYLSRDGCFSLTQTDKGWLGIFDLKYRLLRFLAGHREQETSGIQCTIEEAVIAYLALLFRKVREWFLGKQAGAFGNFDLRWSMNVGIPAAVFQHTVAEALYLEIVDAAWALSAERAPITVENVREIRVRNQDPEKSAKADVVHGLENVTVVPEVAAEVAGYAVSDLRRNGLHLWVDVGAGTLDVCGFVLDERDGDDVYSILSAKVERQGAGVLHAERCARVERYVKAHLQELQVDNDMVAPIPSEFASYIPNGQSIAERLGEFDNGFAELCRKTIHSVVDELRRRRDPHSPAWRDVLPVFLCGGGRELPAFKRALEGIDDWLKEQSRSKGIHLLPLEKPRNLECPTEEPSYHRLAVAWGLSQPAYDIGQFFNPSQIEDVRQDTEEVAWWRRESVFISKDQV